MPGSFEVDSWIYQQWAYLIGRLNDEKEGDKRMLDTSVVTFMNNMTLGLHTWNDVPAFLAGSCGGYFKTGRCVKNTAPSAFHPPLLVSIANAMGFDQLQSWGDPEYNSGPMPGLT